MVCGFLDSYKVKDKKGFSTVDKPFNHLVTDPKSQKETSIYFLSAR